MGRTQQAVHAMPTSAGLPALGPWSSCHLGKGVVSFPCCQSRSSLTPEVSSCQGLEGDLHAGVPVSEPAPFTVAVTLTGVFDSVSTCSLSGPAHRPSSL